MDALQSKIGTHSLGKDRWGRSYWVFNAIPGIYVESDDVRMKPSELNSSSHSEKVTAAMGIL